jgi:hypothetical protein
MNASPRRTGGAVGQLHRPDQPHRPAHRPGLGHARQIAAPLIPELSLSGPRGHPVATGGAADQRGVRITDYPKIKSVFFEDSTAKAQISPPFITADDELRAWSARGTA